MYPKEPYYPADRVIWFVFHFIQGNIVGSFDINTVNDI